MNDNIKSILQNSNTSFCNPNTRHSELLISMGTFPSLWWYFHYGCRSAEQEASKDTLAWSQIPEASQENRAWLLYMPVPTVSESCSWVASGAYGCTQPSAGSARGSLLVLHCDVLRVLFPPATYSFLLMWIIPNKAVMKYTWMRLCTAFSWKNILIVRRAVSKAVSLPAIWLDYNTRETTL